jgi:hypothetical protein
VASRFHLAADWASRLSVGAGVSETDGRFFPRGPWRPLSADELSQLTADCEFGPDAEAGCLFQIPEHLRAAWWELLDRSVETGATALSGFDGFTQQIAAFLRFKGLEVPPNLQMETVVKAAGRCSMRSDPETGAPAGLGPSLAPWAKCPLAEGVLPRLWAGVNLGDEPTQLVFIAHTIEALPTHTVVGPPQPTTSTTVGDLVAWFLRNFPDCSPLRLRLGPGEGFRLPLGGLILDGDASDKLEPDVLLLISEQPVA